MSATRTSSDADAGGHRLPRVRHQGRGRPRANPTDDLVSILVNAEIDGERLTDEDVIGETLLILIGGDETTRHVIAGGVEQLLRNPQHWEP